ncbi:MAG: zinc-dependent alcohol dehydrogenase [Bacillota bacterium]|jgi:threonine dehydrogenase-like Zn-dependent dehydrogenase
MDQVKAMVLEAPRKMVMKTFPMPDITPEGMIIKIDMVGICGGDPIEYEGKNQKTHYPLILGHELVGTVYKIGSIAKQMYTADVGDKVTIEPYIVCGKCYYCLNSLYQFCEHSKVYGVNITSSEEPYLWGAYAEYMYVAPGSKVHKIETDVPDEAACMSSVLGNGVRWVRTLGQVKFGESVVIIGPGAQGLTSIIAAKEAGAYPIIILGRTRNPEKWALAKEYGADYVVDITKDDPVEMVNCLTQGKLADVVIETTGAEAMMELGIHLARPAARYIMVGTCGFERNALTTDIIVFKELKVIGGLGQSWDTEPAVKIINSRKYPVEKLVTHVYPLEKADEAMNFYMNNNGSTIRVAIKP